MKINDINISKAFLESGNDFKITESLTVTHPSLDSILALGNGINCEMVYWQYVYTLLNDPYENMVWLDDMGFDYEKTSAFDVLLLKWEQGLEDYETNKEKYSIMGISSSPIIDIFQKSLQFFLGASDFNIGIIRDTQKKVLYSENNHAMQIDEDIFNYITVFVRMINGIEQTDKINPVNEAAKRILIEDKRDELRRKLSNSPLNNNDDSDMDYIGKMISGVVYGGNGSVTPFNFKQLKIYQLVSALKVNQKLNHYNHVMNGVYFGTVKFESIKSKELDWLS